MKSQFRPLLRASSRVVVAPASLRTASTATATRVSTKRGRRSATRPQQQSPYAGCPFSQQTCRLYSSQTESTQHGSAHSHPISLAGFLAWSPAEAVAGVTVHGYVRSVRTMKKVSFVTLGDGSALAPLQAVVPAPLAEGITNGAAIRLQGSWGPSQGAGQSHELQVDEVDILGPSDAKTFPIQKKYQTPEYLRTMPHLRPRISTNAALLRFRSDVIASLNRFFASRDFVQTQPPLITSSDCEGAGEVFSVSPAGADEKTPDFFRSPKYLTVSTQLHLEALAQAVGNVWTLSPTFRAEESDTPRHLSEFYMLEAEVSFVDRMDGVMDLVEDMLRFVAAENSESSLLKDLLHSKNKSGGTWEDAHVVEQRWQGLLSPERWPRITYTEAVAMLQAAPVPFEHAPTWGAPLQTEHEKYLASAVGGNGSSSVKTPVFVTQYPRASKAFYMLPTAAGPSSSSPSPSPSAGKLDTVDCFDLLVPDFCEIAGGSMREHRLAELVSAMKARGMPVSGGVAVEGDGQVVERTTDEAGTLGWYVDLRRWGCPPHGGFGLGFDRLLCYLTGVQTIRDMVAFPRWYGRCDC
ncbi:asparaginyl-trna synthetase [Ophiostoma piceae UAMH 11346]|uniref:asparagine--tRNA ligase n=1 Tax=Ophiostoma piceae (strain UAMH 11346) TaxID=1262450 RepID=S3BVB7_OPHP1|nr:asparaginyl-trna synthetase [Ophiostoma piceae UAMH 11346]